jgi:hypothetical protein
MRDIENITPKIQVRGLPGSTIDNAIKESIALAQSMGCLVELSFNGTILLITQSTDFDLALKEYWNRL